MTPFERLTKLKELKQNFRKINETPTSLYKSQLIEKFEDTLFELIKDAEEQ